MEVSGRFVFQRPNSTFASWLDLLSGLSGYRMLLRLKSGFIIRTFADANGVAVMPLRWHIRPAAEFYCRQRDWTDGAFRFCVGFIAANAVTGLLWRSVYARFCDVEFGRKMLSISRAFVSRVWVGMKRKVSLLASRWDSVCQQTETFSLSMESCLVQETFFVLEDSGTFGM